MRGSCYTFERDHVLLSSQRWCIDNVGPITFQKVLIDPARFDDTPIIKRLSTFLGENVDTQKYKTIAHVVGDGWEMYHCFFENGINERVDVFAEVDDDVLALQLKLTNFV
jgi:hypothetical protein